MRTFGLALLAALGGYLVGLFGGMLLTSLLSTNSHDKSIETVMTGFFVAGPLGAVLAFVAALAYLLRRG